jgi:mevalonate pyrophosphate decarboxylase
MNISAIQSSNNNLWVASASRDPGEMRNALQRRDIRSVGHLMEHNALKMHGLLMAT